MATLLDAPSPGDEVRRARKLSRDDYESRNDILGRQCHLVLGRDCECFRVICVEGRQPWKGNASKAAARLLETLLDYPELLAVAHLPVGIREIQAYCRTSPIGREIVTEPGMAMTFQGDTDWDGPDGEYLCVFAIGELAFDNLEYLLGFDVDAGFRNTSRHNLEPAKVQFAMIFAYLILGMRTQLDQIARKDRSPSTFEYRVRVVSRALDELQRLATTG